jgi:uncharacterized protein
MDKCMMIQVAPPKSLSSIIASVRKKVPPLWPLKDYVAVNPYLGFSDNSFLSTRQSLTQIRSCDLLMSTDYYQGQIQSGGLTADDLSQALVQCVAEYPSLYEGICVNDLRDALASDAARITQERRFLTVAEWIDNHRGTAWSAAVVDEVSRHCAAQYDEGQAFWQSPWKEEGVFESWRHAMEFSRRFELLGITGFRRFVSELPSSPVLAIGYLLEFMKVPRLHWENFLLSQLGSIAGWASYVRCLADNADETKRLGDDVVGLLAIRLAYDGGLYAAGLLPSNASLWPSSTTDSESLSPEPEWEDAAPSMNVLVRYACLVASEIRYRSSLANVLDKSSVSNEPVTKPLVQMVFCIDVRSEVMRRHLESVTPEIKTFGFAGFFGLPIQYIPLGETHGSAQCPVLLKPAMVVNESINGMEASQLDDARRRRQVIRLARGAWRSFQQSATSCFTFVESLGWWYALSLVRSTLRWSKGSDHAKFDGVKACSHQHLGPSIDTGASTLNSRVEFAAGILKNLGLTDGHARLVVLCGHASETVNNPYRAGLDCGACGGHSGESNARAAAALLNQADVRRGLRERGIDLSDDVRFMASLHNTTTDEITFFADEMLGDESRKILAQLQDWTKKASVRCRLERSLRLDAESDSSLIEKARDWSEVRPEWGLAGNAAFIVAPRSRTAGLNLEGRAFLHSYEHQNDHDSKVLELIMTAPMIVTNWINLQYYASTVDNAAYGSGNKVLHNVVGGFGVLQGNGLDLMTGLPWQSIHDGKKYQHEPLRLSVFIEAPREKIASVVRSHDLVSELVCNGWLTLLAIEDSSLFQFGPDGQWRPLMKSSMVGQ